MCYIFNDENFESSLSSVMYLYGIHHFDKCMFRKGVTFLSQICVGLLINRIVKTRLHKRLTNNKPLITFSVSLETLWKGSLYKVRYDIKPKFLFRPCGSLPSMKIKVTWSSTTSVAMVTWASLVRWLSAWPMNSRMTTKWSSNTTPIPLKPRPSTSPATPTLT